MNKQTDTAQSKRLAEALRANLRRRKVGNQPDLDFSPDASESKEPGSSELRVPSADKKRPA